MEQIAVEAMGNYHKVLDKCLPDTLRQSLPVEDKIIEYICIRFGFERSELMARNRQDNVNVPRQIAIFFIKKNTRLSLKKIGAIFGNRDHTTVMNAVKNVNNRFDVDKHFKSKILEISSELEAYLK